MLLCLPLLLFLEATENPVLKTMVLADEAAWSKLWSLESNTNSKTIYITQRASYEVLVRIITWTLMLKPFGLCYVSI